MWKNRLVWAVAVVATGVLWFFVNNAESRFLFLAVLLVPVMCASLVVLPRRIFKVSLEGPKTGKMGEKKEWELRVSHRSFVPMSDVLIDVKVQNLHSMEKMDQKYSFRIPINSESTLRFSVDSEHCGCIHIEAGPVRIFDPFHLFRRTSDVMASADCFIMPERYPVTPAFQESSDRIQESESYSSRRPGYDPGETFQIREYVPGDSIRQIHWKLSGKVDRTMVRDFGLPVEDQILILIENGTRTGEDVDPEQLDLVAETAFSLASALTREEIPFSLVHSGEDGVEISACHIDSEEEVFRTLSAFLKVPAAMQKVCSVSESYIDEFRSCDFAHVVVISSEPEPDAALLYNGNYVTMITPEQSDEIRTEPSVKWVRISHERLASGCCVFQL